MRTQVSWAGVRRGTALAGIGFVVLQLVAQSLIQVGGIEPSFGAPVEEIVRFFQSRNQQLFAVGAYLQVVGLLAFVWFVGGLWALLREAEGPPAWRSMIAFGSGLAFIASLSVGWELAMFRIDQGMDPQIARLTFDMGNLGFANSWIALASLLLAAGWVIWETRLPAGWLGWGAVVIGVGLLAARAVWTSAAAFAPYLLFWIWLIALSVVLLRRSRDSRARG